MDKKIHKFEVYSCRDRETNSINSVQSSLKSLEGNPVLILKFGDYDGPNLCRVKKVDVSPTLIENYFDLVWSGPNKIDKKNC